MSPSARPAASGWDTMSGRQPPTYAGRSPQRHHRRRVRSPPRGRTGTILRSQVQRRYLGGDRSPGRVDRFATPRSQRGAERRCDPAPAACRGSPQGQPRGGCVGSTRPAPVRRHRTAPRARRRVRDLDNDGHHPGARPRRARGRGRRSSGAACAPVRPHQVPGRRAARPRGAGPGQGRRRRCTEAQRAEQLKRLDGVATILAKTAARDTSLLALLAEDAVVSDAAATLKREMLAAAGLEAAPEEHEPERAGGSPAAAERRVVPQSVVAAPARQPVPCPRLLGAARAPRARAGSPAGSCSARCSVLRARRRRLLLHGAARAHVAARARRPAS